MMGRIIPLLFFEEGYRTVPYVDTQGYPTVGCGVKLGPKGAPIEHYTFRLPLETGKLWTEELIGELRINMQKNPEIEAALDACNGPRTDILTSMAYQMGIEGLTSFKKTLSMVASRNFSGAAHCMLDSLWASQTPARAKRHAEVMRLGTYAIYDDIL